MGRKTESHGSLTGPGRSQFGGPGEELYRDLGPSGELGGVIFGATNATITECLTKKLFGALHRCLIRSATL